MKGFYILAFLILLVLVLLYLALAETDADLKRSYGFLLQAVETMESKLKSALEPIKKLRSEKPTFKLEKVYDRLRKRVGGTRKKLNAARHSIDNVSAESREATKRSLATMREETDGLLLEINLFLSTLETIGAFIGKFQPLEKEINSHLAKIARFAAGRSQAAPLPEETETRIAEAIETSRQIFHYAGETITIIWEDADQGKIFAETTVNEARKCLSSLETLLKDLSIE